MVNRAVVDPEGQAAAPGVTRELIVALGSESALAEDWSRRCEIVGHPVATNDALKWLRDLIADLADAPATATAPHDEEGAKTLLWTPVQLRCLRDAIKERLLAHLPLEEVADAIVLVDTATDRVVGAALTERLAELEKDARHDPLTDAGNRRALDEDLGRELARAIRHDRQVTVLVVDLDGLKAINDTRGHEAGDDALRKLVHSFRGQLRVSDSIYRIGGDEFVVVLLDTSDVAVEALVTRTALTAPAFSVGAATAPRDGKTARELIEAADRHMFEKRRALSPSGQGAPAAPIDIDGEAPAAPRIELDGLRAVYEGTRFSAEVTLTDGRARATGSAQGPTLPGASHRAVADATMNAFEQLLPDVDGYYVHDAELTTAHGIDIATVTVSILTASSTDTLVGSATCPRSQHEGIVRAVLSATRDRAPLTPLG